jgi:hypothetical protein
MQLEYSMITKDCKEMITCKFAIATYSILCQIDVIRTTNLIQKKTKIMSE